MLVILAQVPPEVAQTVAQAAAQAVANAPLSVTDILLLITGITTAIVTIINALKGRSDRQVLATKADDAAYAAKRAEQGVTDSAAVLLERTTVQDRKLDQIHEATNGGVQLLRDKLVLAEERITALDLMVQQLVNAQSAGMPKP